VKRIPKVSVLLPVYNGGQYLREAVDSILCQTFTDFELIAINDGSTDDSAAILDSYADARMRVIHQANIGLALTLNRAIGLAQGQYLARQDADDVSLPSRLDKQVAYLDEHPECGLLGGWTEILEGDVLTGRGHAHPTTNGALQFRGVFDSFFVHSSVLARRDCVVSAGAYPTDPQRNPPEDFDLWSRMARTCALANLPEVLLQYREVPGSISRQKAALINQRVAAIAVENLVALLGTQISKAVCQDLVAIARYDRPSLSDKPCWREIHALLRDMTRKLVQRFPAERAHIEAEQDVLIRRVNQLRLEKLTRLLPVLKRIRALLR
jgi:glycosyltransferase involved in cell wall biosynthesis